MLKKLLLPIVLLILAVLACSSGPSPAEGSAEMIATTSAALSAADVTTVTITVTGPGITTPIVSTLSHSGSTTWQGTISHIPVGADTFQGSAANASGTVLYAGSAAVTITANTTAVVALTLQQVNAPPPFSNSAPIIQSVVLSTNVVAPGGQVNATVAATDPDGDALTYAWSASGGSFNTNSAAAVVWSAPATTGPQTLTIQVTDPSGEQAAVSLTIQVASSASQGSANVTVTVDTWPVVSNVTATPSLINVGQTATLAIVASDADSNPLSYAWTASCTGTFDNASAAAPHFTLGSLPAGGTCTLTVVVSDGLGGFDTGAITINTGAAVSVIVAPQIASAFQSQATAGGGQSVTLSVTANDPQSLALSFAWSATSGAVSGQSSTATSSQATWTSAACGVTTAAPTISVVVSDTAGASTTQTFVVSSTCGTTSNDAGAPDAGGEDAGTDAGTDSSTTPDAGVDAGPGPWSLVAAVAGTPVSVGIAPNSGGTPYVIYVGTSGSGVYASTDGATWTSAGPASIVSLSSMPQANASFASLSNGTVDVTNNSGGSWAATSASPNAVINNWIGIAGVGPLGATSNTSGSALVVQGKSSGATWVASSPFGTGVATSIAFGGGSSPNITVYAGVNGTGGGVFKSVNVGASSYSFATTSFPQNEVLSVATAPTSLSTVFAGTNNQGAGIYVSTNGGSTWSASGTGLGNLVVQALTVDSTNANNVYAGTAAGIYVSKNGGSSWSASGLASSSVTSLAILNGTPTTVYAATSTGLYVTTTGGQ